MPITYNVYRNGEKVAENLSDTTYLDTNLTPETSYEYQVSAVNEYGESELSSVLTVVTEATPTPPEEPQGLEATNVTDTEVELGWNEQ